MGLLPMQLSSVSCSLIFNQFDPSIYKRNRVENRY